MNKIFLSLIIFFAVLLFLPLAKINAEGVYVGVQIASASAPGCYGGVSPCPTAGLKDTNWCLPGGQQHGDGTQMVVMTSDTCQPIYDHGYPPNNVCSANGGCQSDCVPTVSLSDPVVYPTSPTCAGGIIWSGLLTLNTDTDYKVYLYTPNFCPGYMAGGDCWVAATTNYGNCCGVCDGYGLTTKEKDDQVFCGEQLYGDQGNSQHGETCWIDKFGNEQGDGSCPSSHCLSSAASKYNDLLCNIEAGAAGSACTTCAKNSLVNYNSGNGACGTTYINNTNTTDTWVPCSYEPVSGDYPAVPSTAKRICACNVPKYIVSGNVNTPNGVFIFFPFHTPNSF